MKQLFYPYAIRFVLLTMLLLGGNTILFAEGSINFRNYLGNRLFYNVEQNQQLKVYANGGEFINVGSSHVGINGGTIEVYNTVGRLVATFGGAEDSAIIFNDMQELNGPIGGATGYRPGVIPVPIDSGGIWSIRLSYPNPRRQKFTSHLKNGDAWTRAENQPKNSLDRRVALAWDVTVTKGAAGDNGGIPVSGRLYSNEFISILDGNSRAGAERTTSPIFHVLTKGGYLYEVEVKEADPWGFPIFSNNFGLAKKRTLLFSLIDFHVPTYKSAGMGGDVIVPDGPIIRSDNPDDWIEDSTYLYDPQSPDFDGLFSRLINNKIFFSLPDSTLPTSATVTDLNTNQTYTTWLLNQIPFEDNRPRPFTFKGVPPAKDSLEAIEGLGGYFVFDSNLEGQATLLLDFNNNNIFTDAVDVVLRDYAPVGVDSIFWDGKDGTGEVVQATDGLRVNYSLTIRGAENHILLADVENNLGGVKFVRINGPGSPDSTFYYDHSAIPNGGISGTDGNMLLPTTIPYTYRDSFGDKNMLDQWAYIETSNFGTGTIVIVIKKLCDLPTPLLMASAANSCEGDSITLSTATFEGTNILYIWTAINETDTTVVSTTLPSLSLHPITAANTGIYTVTIQQDTCLSAPSNALTLTAVPKPAPPILSVDKTNHCAGESLTFSVAPVIGATYTWLYTNPTDGKIVTLANTSIPSYFIENLSFFNTGIYQVVLTVAGCASLPSNEVVIAVISTDLSMVTATSSAPIENPVCSGTDVGLSVTAVENATYEWIKVETDSLIGTTREVVIANATPATNGAYVVIITINGCPNTLGPVSVQVDDIPDTPIISANNTSVCSDSGFILRTDSIIGENISYDWFFQGTIIATTTEPTLVFLAVDTTNTGNYTVIVRKGNCESAPSEAIAISVVPPLIGNITLEPIGNICAGASIRLTAPNSEGATYAWTGPNGFTATERTIILEKVSGNDNGAYSVIVSINGCPNNFAPINLTIQPKPARPIITANQNTVCPGDLLRLTTAPVSGAAITYDWFFNGIFLANTTVSDFSIENFQAEQVGDYSVLVKEGACVSDTSAAIAIALNEVLEDVSAMANSPVCIGAAIHLMVTDIAGATFSWNGPNEFRSTAQNPIINAATAADGGEYSVSVTTADCATLVLPVAVVIAPKPVTPVVNITDSPVCAGEIAIFTITNPSANTTYTVLDINGNIVASGTENRLEISTTDKVGENTFRVIAEPAGMCPSDPSNPLTLRVISVPEEEAIILTNPMGDACGNVPMTVEAAVPTQGTGLWTSDNPAVVFIVDTNPSTQVMNVGNGNRIIWTLTNIACGNYSADSITINTTIPATIANDKFFTILNTASISDQSIIENDTPSDGSVTLITAATNGTSSITANGLLNYTPNSGFVGEDQIIYELCDTACPNVPCDQATITITVNQDPNNLDCLIPDVITPNDDGFNDLLIIPCAEFKDVSLKIFNRWGDTVYESRQYINDWKGTYKGADLPPGPYYYIFEEAEPTVNPAPTTGCISIVR